MHFNTIQFIIFLNIFFGCLMVLDGWWRNEMNSDLPFVDFWVRIACVSFWLLCLCDNDNEIFSISECCVYDILMVKKMRLWPKKWTSMHFLKRSQMIPSRLLLKPVIFQLLTIIHTFLTASLDTNPIHISFYLISSFCCMHFSFMFCFTSLLLFSLICCFLVHLLFIQTFLREFCFCLFYFNSQMQRKITSWTY